MGITTVKSPNTLTEDMPHPQRGTSPGAYSSPSNATRADQGGHILPHVGKGGPTPEALRRKDGDLGFDPSGPTPVAGGYRSPGDPRE